jgi:hypothetical protein
MELERYFDFLREDDIRLKGTRIGTEIIDNVYAIPGLAERISARVDYYYIS